MGENGRPWTLGGTWNEESQKIATSGRGSDVQSANPRGKTEISVDGRNYVNKLVVHHTYVNGMAFDTSNNRNHGIPYSVEQAPAPYAPSFSFQVPDSRVIIRPSPSLQNLIAVRAVVTFYLAPNGGMSRRYNLIEGEVSFALFVNVDGSLQGTILDPDGNWLGAQTGPNVVSTGAWHQAEIRHDGINQCVLVLDGQVVATSYEARGPVRSVGPTGIAVGHWPEAPGVYTFEGYIREAWVYKYDPLDAARGLLDKCCGDSRKALDAVADQLREKGYTADKAREQGMALLDLAIGAATEVRGSDPAVSQQSSSLAAQALAAFLRGDSASYTTALAQLGALATGRLSHSQAQQLHQKEEDLFKELPLPLEGWRDLISKMCLGKAQIDPKQFASEYEQFKKHSRSEK